MIALQTIPAWDEDDRYAQVAKVAGFCLHAGVAAEVWERSKLKTPYSDGTTHVIFEPLDFIAKLAALVPKPRVNLSTYGPRGPCRRQLNRCLLPGHHAM